MAAALSGGVVSVLHGPRLLPGAYLYQAAQPGPLCRASERSHRNYLSEAGEMRDDLPET